MIQRIRPSEYLSDIQAMTEGERKNYLKRVGEWLADGGQRLLQMTDRPMAKAQNIVQLSTRWPKEDCEEFRNGTLLLTALTKVADTWLPSQLYARSANRAVRQMVTCLQTQQTHPRPLPVMEGSGHTQGGKKPMQEINPKVTQIVAATSAPNVTTPLAHREGQGESLPREGQGESLQGVSPVPVRPKHIDQYVHLLPQKTQERAATVKGLLRDLDVAREKMRLLMDDPKASADSRATWSKTATKLDEKVKAIYRELDAEWEKLVSSGRVTVDDLGNAHVMPAAEATGTVAAERNTGIPGLRNNDEEEAAKAKRIEYLKKWLRDSRTKASDERRKQWEANCKELLSLGGELTDSIRKAGEVYGVDVAKIEIKN